MSKKIIPVIFTVAIMLISSAAIFQKTTAQSVPVINVKDAPYSAKGDGVTDDTSAIQAAVDAAFTAGGGSAGQGAKVYFPDGKYIVTSVKIRDNVTYEGQSKESTIIQRPGAPIVGGKPVSITRESPAKLTTVLAHGLSDGLIVFFSGITQSGWTNLNDKPYILRKIDSNAVNLFEYNPMGLNPTIFSMTKGVKTQIASRRKHGLETGEKITFFKITQAGWTALNGNSYPVTKIDDYKFTIDFDSSSLTDYDAVADPGIQYKNLDTTGFSVDYEASDPGTVFKLNSLQTFTTVGSIYSSDIDSKPLVIKNFTFDANIDAWGPYENYEQEHAAEVFLHADSKKAGKLVAKIDNCKFQNGVADGAQTHVNVDLEMTNVEFENLFRCGLAITGGYSKIRAKNIKSLPGVNETGIHSEVDGTGFGGTYAVDLFFENVDAVHGSFDVGVSDNSVVEGHNIKTGGLSSMYFENSTGRFYDSEFARNPMAIYFPKDLLFERCKFIAAEKYSTEADRTLAAAIVLWDSSWHETHNGLITFKGCSFDADSSVESSDTVYGIQTTNDPVGNNNQLVVENSTYSDKLDTGIQTSSRGGNWTIKDSVFYSPLPLWFNGFPTSGVERWFNIFLDGLVFKSQKYAHIAGYSATTKLELPNANKLENRNIQIDESANVITTNFGIDGNAYTGKRLILGNNPPAASTPGLVGDMYRLKNPVSGQIHEWKCDKTGYSSGIVWTPQPILPAIASLANLPESPTTSQSANITAGGTNITAYKYKLDDGSWSAEAAISNPINITNLANGSHTVSVIGKNSGGEWQPQDRPTTHTWLILGGSITPPPTPIYSKSDLNQDSLINQTDLDILKADFLRLTANLTNPRSDINSDGQCTARDLGILMSGWKP